MDAGELYGLPLDRFVAERNGLARRLRADGQREEAATVAALRKPSVAAYGVNLLAHNAQGPITELIAAGDALRATQDRVLAGDADGRELSRALERERAAVGELTQRAVELLATAGQEPGAAVRERIGETLHAAAFDDDARRLVLAGRLERELRHSGFGGESTEAATPAKAKLPAAAKQTAAEKKAQAAAVKAQAAKAAQARAEAAKAAKAAEAEARREAARTTKALRVAERDEERAAEALRLAQAALSEARAQAESAAAAHARARQALDEV